MKHKLEIVESSGVKGKGEGYLSQTKTHRVIEIGRRPSWKFREERISTESNTNKLFKNKDKKANKQENSFPNYWKDKWNIENCN